MADLVPAGGQGPSLTTALLDPGGGPMLSRLGALAGQPPVRKVLPWFLGVAALGSVALTWAALAPGSQRTLYSQLGDAERAGVVESLDQAGIAYDMDPATGSLSVAESDFYRARMLVASDGALATPETGSQMLDSLPMGASRMLEGERLRAARERDLELTIREIDGVETVRVHLAEAEKSVFVRDSVAPSASVMVRLARGRQLTGEQVGAIVNLVAASVPGLVPDAVRIVDQHGRLVSDTTTREGDRLDLQARMEEKLRRQVAQLLGPMFGAGNFTSEIQVELDMDEVTSARESYDKDGVVRSETEARSQTTGAPAAGGVPGVLANTPPPAAQAEERPPEGTRPAGDAAATNGESSSSRTYELGREVSVSNRSPGGIRRLSVAVALSADAVKGTKPAELKQIEDLVAAAVGADAGRGDRVAVIARNFEPVVIEETAFWEAPWFATVVRNGVALLAVLLVLLLGVRPLLKSLRRERDAEAPALPAAAAGSSEVAETPATPSRSKPDDQALLTEKVGLAQRLVTEQPDSALAALRQMLKDTPDETEAHAA
ncbi:flagellar basal-body MS-ring/collar protein FliF [Novosphingobium marinum]|uniref:Flagellar M-ring protein n=1 Tax=Novosphingobium marinum TaxID=1514948 RepID=A0A7Y9XXM4_9SPHN|nr:flagellar basal-body MS-ring/collar protein FliF [Novosphingobium marinum]NYH94993.1 flagellar M-ring protein FliF [Novosphingobium marinum]